MKIVLFEDEQYKNLLPLVYLRPVWELRCGALTLAEKIDFFWKKKQPIEFTARQYLNDFYLDSSKIYDFQSNQETLFVNGRLLMTESIMQEMSDLSDNTILQNNEEVIAFRFSGNDSSRFFRDGILSPGMLKENFQKKDSDIKLINFPWDLIDHNGAEIQADFRLMENSTGIKGTVEKGVVTLSDENILIAKGARVMPGAILNAEDGLIWIDEDAVVMPNAVLEGPVYVGKKSRIKIGAKIYENTSIGPVCKVGGEVEESILHSYSNKQHDGFLGHACMGSWVNIGADTNNSDLKNNYGEISVSINGYPIETGKHFLGLIMGDHSKTAINTMFNTGTVVGMHCNVFGEGFPPKFIPSFSWGGSDGIRDYRFDKAVEVAKVVMDRRNIEFTDRDLKLFESARSLAEKIENRARIK